MNEMTRILQETNQFLNAILDNTHVSIAFMDSQFNFIRVNRNYAEADKKEVSFYPGKNHFDLFPNKENEEIFQRVVETGEPFFIDAKPFEYAEHPEWGVSYWDWSLIPIKDSKNAVNQLVLTLQDVTERKKSEQKLKESEEMWKALSENSPAHVMILDKEQKIISINRTTPDLTKEEVIGNLIYDYTPQEYHQIAKDCCKRVWDTGKSSTYSTKYITKEGDTQYFDVWIGPIFHSGTVIALVSHSMDVSRQKQSELKLKESEEKWRSITKYAPDHIQTMDINGKILFINYTVPDLTIDEVIGRSVYDFIPEEYKEIQRNVYTKILDTGKSQRFELGYDDKVGNHFHFDVHSGPLYKDEKIIGFINRSTDITYRKEAEKKIRDSEEKFKSIFDKSPIAITLYDSHGKLLDANKACLDLINVPDIDTIKGFSIFDDPNLPEKEKQKLLSGVQVMFEIRYDLDKVEDTLKADKKGMLFLDAIITPIFQHDGQIIYYLNQVQDITERKISEQNIFLQSQIMINMAESVNLVQAKDLKIIYVNPVCEKMFGYESGELIGKHVSIFNASADNITSEETAINILRELEEKGEWHGEVQNIQKNGTLFWCYTNISTFNHVDYGEVFVSVQIDITARKKAEENLRISKEKYQEAYYLINFYKDLFAHDMSNILQNIISSVNFYSAFQNDPERLKSLGDIAHVVKNHAKRGATLIANVRKLSKLDENETVLNKKEIFTFLNKAVKDTISGFQERNVNIEIDGLSEDLCVLGNELLIDVFENVLNNAVKYDDNEKEVKINIKISKIHENGINYLNLEFKDHGMGIPDERKETIFLKEYNEDISKRGMGLGLSLVKNIVESYGGKIWFDDRIKGDYTKGSNFVLLLKEAE